MKIKNEYGVTMKNEKTILGAVGLLVVIIYTIALAVSYDECDGELVMGVFWYECIEKQEG